MIHLRCLGSQRSVAWPLSESSPLGPLKSSCLEISERIDDRKESVGEPSTRTEAGGELVYKTEQKCVGLSTGVKRRLDNFF